LLPRVP